MNTGIAISFIVGGLLLISIITLNGRVIQNSGETVLDMSAKQRVESVTTLMTHDFNRMGLNMAIPTADPVISVNSQNKIVFLADVDDDHSAASSAVQITWEFVTGSQNYLNRTNAATGKTSKIPIETFEFTFWDENNNTTTNEAEVRSISVSLVAQADQSYGNNDKAKSLFEKRFTPPGLNFNRIR